MATWCPKIPGERMLLGAVRGDGNGWDTVLFPTQGQRMLPQPIHVGRNPKDAAPSSERCCWVQGLNAQDVAPGIQ